MSHQTGIKSNENLRNMFAKCKEGKIRLLKVSITDKEELTLDKYHDVHNSDWKSDYSRFVVDCIESKTPCYIFFRLDEKTNTGYSWLLIAWSPDFASIKQKMLYAATKSTVKLEFGAGQIKDELFGTVKEDVTLDGYLKHIKSQLAPAPLTNREEELELLRQHEDLTRINVDTKQKTLQGVMFPISQEALSSLDSFKKERVDYVQLEIDLKGEKILSNNFNSNLNSVEEIKGEIPRDKGRFHLFRFKHTHEGEKFKSIIFIYSMPGFSVSIKERMVYSSTKSEIVQYLKSNLGIEVTKTFEISDSSELGESYLIDELHPKK